MHHCLHWHYTTKRSLCLKPGFIWGPRLFFIPFFTTLLLLLYCKASLPILFDSPLSSILMGGTPSWNASWVYAGEPHKDLCLPLGIYPVGFNPINYDFPLFHLNIFLSLSLLQPNTISFPFLEISSLYFYLFINPFNLLHYIYLFDRSPIFINSVPHSNNFIILSLNYIPTSFDHIGLYLGPVNHSSNLNPFFFSYLDHCNHFPLIDYQYINSVSHSLFTYSLKMDARKRKASEFVPTGISKEMLIAAIKSQTMVTPLACQFCRQHCVHSCGCPQRTQSLTWETWSQYWRHP